MDFLGEMMDDLGKKVLSDKKAPLWLKAALQGAVLSGLLSDNVARFEHCSDADLNELFGYLVNATDKMKGMIKDVPNSNE